LEYYQQWFSLASKEIDQLHGDLEELERQLNSSEETLSLKDELIMLKNKVYFSINFNHLILCSSVYSSVFIFFSY